MSANTKMAPVQLIGASFLSGALAVYAYNKYLLRVREVGERRASRTSSARQVDPLTALFSQNDIGLHVLNHLARVYTTLGGTTLMAVLGVFLQWRTKFSTALSSLISLGLAFSMLGKSELWKLLALGLFEGMSLGGLVKIAAQLNPAIVPLSLGSTTLIFSSFAAAATLSKRRSFLFLYGALGSALSILSLTSLANSFYGSRQIFDFNIYGSLFLFMGYVVADSQMIIERADQGDEDYVSHAWMLFTDLSAIFSRMLIILLEQSQREKDRKKKRDEDES